MAGGKTVDNSFRRIALAQGFLPASPVAPIADPVPTQTEDRSAESAREVQPVQS